jgi:hypothetical protein
MNARDIYKGICDSDAPKHMLLVFHLLGEVMDLHLSHFLEVVAVTKHEAGIALGVDHITPAVDLVRIV